MGGTSKSWMLADVVSVMVEEEEATNVLLQQLIILALQRGEWWKSDVGRLVTRVKSRWWRAPESSLECRG